jgi:hypothetical protein
MLTLCIIVEVDLEDAPNVALRTDVAQRLSYNPEAVAEPGTQRTGTDASSSPAVTEAFDRRFFTRALLRI